MKTSGLADMLMSALRIKGFMWLLYLDPLPGEKRRLEVISI